MDAYIVVFETFAGLDLPLQPALLMDVLSKLICIAGEQGVRIHCDIT